MRDDGVRPEESQPWNGPLRGLLNPHGRRGIMLAFAIIPGGAVAGARPKNKMVREGPSQTRAARATKSAEVSECPADGCIVPREASPPQPVSEPDRTHVGLSHCETRSQQQLNCRPQIADS